MKTLIRILIVFFMFAAFSSVQAQAAPMQEPAFTSEQFDEKQMETFEEGVAAVKYWVPVMQNSTMDFYSKLLNADVVISPIDPWPERIGPTMAS